MSVRRLPHKIRYSAAEWATLQHHAQACGIPPATYARLTSLQITPPLRRGHADAELLRQLGRIGNTLNQLARTAHTTGHLSLETVLRSAVTDLLSALQRIRS